MARTATFSAEEWEAYERAKMAEQDARGALTVARQEGLAEGQAAGRRDSLRRILELRGITLTEEEQNTLSRCADLGMLDQWLRKALMASTVAQIFA